METDIISHLVEEAHGIFNAASIYEVIALDKHTAIEVLNKIYDTPPRQGVYRPICAGFGEVEAGDTTEWY